MITAVWVAHDFRAGRERFRCEEARGTSDVRFICGACLDGTVIGGCGAACSGCGARVVKVEYDSPGAAAAVF